MSNEEDRATESNGSSPASSTTSEAKKPSTTPAGSSKKSKASKPRLTASQKNFNHKDAENKRRTAIRERFTELSQMVPGAQGQERSEQVMLGKTTDFLRDMLQEQRRLEALADAQGIPIDDSTRMRDDDYGGPQWVQPNMAAYESSKQKKSTGDSQSATKEDDENE
ncbi:uncharacterized protein A1O9_00082 [Exophiala aquamarina CBS 119918]|uniref:BHLH domain-containing protein n=1 Tax=Exophiala aquamarina CBS 119918 TaxID=1182545 RepID=A0A072Q2I0_9EURO|nr:uncharacterized protein A1O9_00082 [Exophiala aquamarina CBS 119918]KEF62110.1 hypothetical protein A1O9_00082 [Exophiala aquamarina CBS 119918]